MDAHEATHEAGTVNGAAITGAVDAVLPLALQAAGVSKTFVSTTVLHDFSLEVAAGEIHALAGENGSGKSTFIKILAGFHQPDHGHRAASVGGTEITLGNADSAYDAGCRFVHQDLGLIHELSVMDNLFLNSGFPTRLLNVHTKKAMRLAQDGLERLQLNIDPRSLVGELSAAERTGVAVVRALMADQSAPVKLMVFDEPTANLPADEVERLLQLVEKVAKAGVGVIYVTHRLDEIFQIASRVTVLRDGHHVATRDVAEVNHGDVVRLLVGDDFELPEAAEKPEHGDASQTCVMTATGVYAAHLHGVDIRLAPGEIVGVAGITGSGRERLLAALFGEDPRPSGEVVIDGKTVAPYDPKASMNAGMAYLPADRKVKSGIMELTVRENFMLANLALGKGGKGSRKRQERAEVINWCENLDVRPRRRPEAQLGTFSGGNQQKVLLAKWLRLDPLVLLLDEPTQGVDIGARQTIYRYLKEAAVGGAGVMVSSSDVEELALLCDRVLIMQNGRIATELRGHDLNATTISHAVLKKNEPKASV